MFSSEQLIKLKRLFQDPDWKLVDKMLREYIEPLLNIQNVDLSDLNKSVKGEIKAKIQFYVLIDKFLKDAQVIAESKEISEVNNKDSME